MTLKMKLGILLTAIALLCLAFFFSTALQKLNAARAVFNKIPPASIDVIMKSWQQTTGMTELNADDDNTIREYLCIKAYLVSTEVVV